MGIIKQDCHTMNGSQNSQIVAIEDHQHGISPHTNSPQNGMAIKNMGYEDHPQHEDDEIDIADLFRIISNHKKLIFFITTIVSLITLLYTLSITPTYRATTSIKIDTEADKLAHYDDVFAEKNIDSQTFHQTQYDLIKSHTLAKRVIEKLDLEEKFKEQTNLKPFYSNTLDNIKNSFSKIVSPIVGSVSTVVSNESSKKLESNLGEKPVEMQFIDNLTISPSKRSNVVKIHFDSFDPQLAASSVNTLVNEFISMNLEGMSESSSYAKQYLTEQIALAKDKLETSETNLVKYAKEKQIIKTDTKNSLVSNALDVLNEAYTQSQKELIEAESEYRQRSKVSGNIRMLDNAVIQSLKTQRSQLETKYKQQLQVYKPVFPAMIELKKQINETQRQIKAELTNIKSKSQNDLQSRFFAAREKEDMLGKKLDLKKAELLAQRDKGIGYGTLQREVETNRQLYDNLLQRMKEVGIAGGVVSNNISIVDPAFVPYSKHTPNTTRNVLIGSLLGLMLGLAVAFLRERLDDRIKTVQELENLSDLPVLGIFPFIKKKNRKDAAVILEDRHSVEAEAFRSLITNLGYINSDGLPKILHITSAAPSEGKSNTAINAAMVITESKKSVLLIDADLRKPKVGKYLNKSHTSGLTDYLVGKQSLEDIIIHSNVDGLDLVTAGAPAPSPSQLLSDDKMLELLEFAATQYDHVVIDSPPVLGLADALILANRSNATLFVVASNETKKAHIADAIKRLHLGYANIIGFVLTKAKSSKKDYYSYDNYYGYRDTETVKLVYNSDKA